MIVNGHSSYDAGFSLGEFKRDNPDYDARGDFVDAAKIFTLSEFDAFRAGFEAGVRSGS